MAPHEALDDRRGMAHALVWPGQVAYAQGDSAGARARYVAGRRVSVAAAPSFVAGGPASLGGT